MMLAGRCLPCGSLAAMTSPVSRSATSHASADTSLGSGGVPGAVITPQPESASPPIGLAGTGSGPGAAWPGLGTSDASIAGGVDCLYGHALVSGAAFGWAPATAGEANRNNAATRAAARWDEVRTFAMVSAD